MRFYLWLFLFVGVVAGIFWYLNQAPPPPPPAPAPPTVAPAPRRAEQTFSVAPQAAPATPAPVAPRAQQAAPAAPASSSHRAAVEIAARKAGVRIVSYAESGGNVTVRIEWSTDNAGQGGDFLDAMIRSGMRDFDDLGKGQRREGSRRIFHGSYRLKM